ncbi:hypothetical protein VNI00_015789 [Paramarasmius palmivorus]|uniref:Uncharacterized protein n=1 Tax=Paramarasmius palmivorus TaxID=297713 RepID=A0AAW0BI90_9AGAR
MLVDKRLELIDSFELGRPRIALTEHVQAANFILNAHVAYSNPTWSKSRVKTNLTVLSSATTLNPSSKESIINSEGILDSTLFAQLVANAEFNKESQTDQWYGKYKSVLENLGWIVTNFNFEEGKLQSQEENHNGCFSVDVLVTEHMSQILPTGEIELVKRTIESIQARRNCP